MQFQAILKFWFTEIQPIQWFKKDLEFDQRVRERFSVVLDAAKKSETAEWRGSAAGRLAEIILLDQFSRNIHRDTPKAFESDGIALTLAQEMVLQKLDNEIPIEQRGFIYMPYMHSESLHIHDQALKCFNQKGLEDNFEFEKKHRAIIERFGRYPHRNKILGRSSTPEEVHFLQQPGSGF